MRSTALTESIQQTIVKLERNFQAQAPAIRAVLYGALSSLALDPPDNAPAEDPITAIQNAIGITRAALTKIEQELYYMRHENETLENCRSLVFDIISSNHCAEHVAAAVRDLDRNQTGALVTLAKAILQETGFDSSQPAEPFDGNVC